VRTSNTHKQELRLLRSVRHIPPSTGSGACLSIPKGQADVLLPARRPIAVQHVFALVQHVQHKLRGLHRAGQHPLPGNLRTHDESYTRSSSYARGSSLNLPIPQKGLLRFRLFTALFPISVLWLSFLRSTVCTGPIYLNEDDTLRPKPSEN